MNFLSHHEFGLGQKKFKFKETSKKNNFENLDKLLDFGMDKYL